MTRGRKIALIVGGSLAGLLLLVVIAGIVVVQTDWFRNFARTRIVEAVETGTGGTAAIGRFHFDWTHMRADVYDFVIHGTEGPQAAPLFRAKHLEVNFKLTTPSHNFVGISYLLVETPQANVIVYADGHTNIPTPKTKKTSDKTGLETVVDLAIGRFDLRNGSATFADRKAAFDASGANLHAQLGYDPVNPHYRGQLDIRPLFLKSGGNRPLDVNVKLPVTLAEHTITLSDAELTTPRSRVDLTGTISHLASPDVSAHVKARVAVDEVKRVADLDLPLDTTHAPEFVNADVNASVTNGNLRLDAGKITYGNSTIEASGTLMDTAPDAIQFHTTLSLGEIGRLLKLSARPEGTLHVGGNLALRRNQGYLLTGNVDAQNVSVRQGNTRLGGIDMTSAIKADPNRIEVSGLRASALGGFLTGSGALQNQAQFQFSGNLHHFDIARVAQALSTGKLGYDGVVSGPVEAEGNLEKKSDLVARANLSVAPGPHGVPVSGRLNVDYNARADTVTIARSHLQLPHTRVDISGSLGRRIQARVVSHDLDDFRPVAPSLPVKLENGGTAAVNATVTGTLSAPRIQAQLQMTNFAASGRRFGQMAADVTASPSGATVTNGVLAHGALQARFSGSVGMRHWQPQPNQPLRLEASVRNADMADVLALAGKPDVPVTGALTVDVHVAGTVGSPRGNADLSVLNGTVEGEPFDRLTAQAVMTDRSIDIPGLQWTAGPSHLDATASYQHQENDLQHGSLRVHVASNQVQLAQFQALVKDRPGLRGLLSVNGDATADIAGFGVQFTGVNANLAARGLEMEGKSLGDFRATAASAGSTVQYNVTSDFAGSTIHVNGQSLLTGDHQTTATAEIAGLPIDRVLAVAGKREVPVTGVLAANARLSGTLLDPHASGEVTITKVSAYQQPFDRLQATLRYTNQLIDVPSFRVETGPSWIEANASFAHPANDLQNGQVRFHLQSNDVQLAGIHTIEQSEPGLAGVVQLAADGAATLRQSTPEFSALNANFNVKNLRLNQQRLGDLTATAHTTGGAAAISLTSNLGGADIRGTGSLQLAGDHSVNAHLTFANLTYAGLSPLMGGKDLPLDAGAAGDLTLSGPLANTAQMRGRLQLSKVEAHSEPATGGRQPRVNFELHNAAPMVVALDHNVVTVQNARLVGPFTNLAVTGSASLGNPQSLDVHANGNLKLDLLEAFSPDIFSSGNVVLNAAVTGTTGKPVVNGRLQLQDASFNMTSLPNGISGANGTVLFSGTQAVIQNLTGETGGGKITLTGFTTFGGPEMRFQLEANAAHIHVTEPENVTTQASAKLTLAGVTSRSLLSGNVTIEEVALHSHSDIGSILTQAATPPAVRTASTGVLGGIRFDVKIQTATDTQFRTTLTQDLKADANLTLRGNVDNPGMLGRVVVTQGDVVFFGSKYTIDQGTVSFFNPQKINPVLNIDLETTVQGIDVSLSVTGPMDKMKLSYRSDPPMMFSDLVSLLASGKVPTTDPVLAARQPVAPQQNFEQAGASTLLGQTVANPVSGRLQRLFGVSKLKIDPQITGASNTPQATLTLQQQITRDITFTYISDVTSSNPQIVRIEWAIDPHWSATAERDLNGMFDLDFFYKKRFH